MRAGNWYEQLPATRVLVESAVLVPLYRAASGEIRLIMVVRGSHGLHADQVGFPGGRAEPRDRDLLATALRKRRRRKRKVWQPLYGHSTCPPMA